MQIGWALLLLASAVFALPVHAAHPTSPASGALVEEYCLSCHNTTDWAGGLSLEGASHVDPSTDAAMWEKVVRKLRTGMMPPPGEPRPARELLDGFSRRLATGLDATAASWPNPGSKSLHRLNRTEYANAIRDLLAYPIDVSTLLPADDSAEGFDNMADVLGVSPTLIQAQVSAAMKISRAVTGDLGMAPELVRYDAPTGAAQLEYQEGMPLGTRGGVRFTHVFPLDAEYEFRVSGGGNFRFTGTDAGPAPKLDVTINGEPLVVPDPRRFRLRVKAGPQIVTVAFVEQRRSRGVDDLYSRSVARPDSVQNVTIQGPFAATDRGDTPSRRAIFICRPGSPAEEIGCARRILAHLSGRAFRQPIVAKDPAVDVLLPFYEAGHREGGFEVGIQQALARILVDPRFLYRIEADRTDVAEGQAYRVSDIELASRLSFFLWSSIPDEPLLALATRGELSKPRVLEREVRRMLADPRAQALVENFAGQWLRLRELGNAQPEDRAFDDALRLAFQKETQMLFASVVSGDRSIVDLLDADYTFLNERLAKHYGIAGVRGTYMRQVALPADSPRRGLLGQGSILTVTSVGNRTSPVIRGAWVLEGLLGAHVPQPPPGVEADLKETPGVAPKSVRERLEMHRAAPSCAACHRVMDPIGFAMENFDLVGRWRDTDGGSPVNASDTLVDGTRVNGVSDLRRALLSRSDAFVTGASEKLLTYALGRRLEYYDQPAVRRIVEGAARDNNRFAALVLGVVNSVPFQMKSRRPAGG